nr:hypothetical protein [Tanacetum cinerariifolium]
MTHTWVQDQRIDAQDTLIATLSTHLSSLQGHLMTALGEIQALQAREQARAGAPESAGSSTRTTRLNPGATSDPNQAPSTTTTTITNAQLQAMIDQGVTAALAARDANRTGDDSHTSGTGVRRTKRITRECTYQDFMKCQPLYFKGTEGVVELTQWFERMETVFRISNCLAENQTKFATCTLLAGALTWWNSHVRIVGSDATYVMTWIELKKKMADKYCSRNEMKKIETELWNLEVQEESDRVERYIGGLPDSIHGSVPASKPKTIQEATEMATRLMDKKIRTYAERQDANKRKFKDTSRNNQSRQQPPKRQDVVRAYATGSDNRQQYAGSTPLCPKCNFNHDGPCIPRCYKCNKIGHIARDCRSPTNANVANNQRDSEDSTVTYTTVSSPYEGRSGDVSPGADGPPVMPEDPYAYVVAAFQAIPSPDYVPGPEEPEQAPPSPVYIPYVPEPEYPEYIPPEDEDAERFLVMHIPPPSPLTLLSSPLPHIPSPQLPTSPPILPIPLPTASPPLQLLSSDCRPDRPEVTFPPQK